jgi:imidazolonepropionase
MNLLLKNIKKLCQIRNKEERIIKGSAMAHIPCIEDAYLLITNGVIETFGSMAHLDNARLNKNEYEVIDATDKMVLPAFCDSHTHLVFASWRESEFTDKIKGVSYEEIAAKGGGILNSAKRLQQIPEQQLLEDAFQRLEEIKSFGTGAVEIKSGYGLTTDAELKMLRVIQKLKSISPLTIKATFLGAHAYPAEFKNNHEAYLQLIIQEMLPRIADEGLADYVDVFCDRGFFSADDTARILEAAAKYNLTPKIHANELDYSGGVQVGVKYHARSVDHLECTGDEEIKILLQSDTMPTLLPSTAFFLGLHYPPARKMIDSGLPVALASDYNPGTSPGGRMSFIISLACIQMKMTPEEALNAATLNGAYAMGVEDSLGSITISKKANLILTKPMQDLALIPYRYANDMIEKVIIAH